MSFSGDKLEIKGDRIKRVYKYSDDFYFLYSQVKKFNDFARIGLAQTPSEIYKKDKYCFSYIYTDGPTLLEFIRDNDIKMIKETLDEVIDSMQKFHTMGIIHGDLSFDNIIIGAKLQFIDMIKNSFNHRWFDYAKLYQCVELNWGEIRYGYKIKNLKEIREYLDKRIDEIDPTYRKYHKTMLVYILTRILERAKKTKNKEIEKKIKDKIIELL